MTALTYTKFELRRTFRNKRFFIFSLAFPLVMYYLVAGPNRHDHNFGGSATVHTGLFAPQYYMVGLLAFGTMTAVLAGGARIAAERQDGWNRQLRLTPLTPRSYFRAKVITSYAMALASIVLLYSAGLTMGVRMSAGQWLQMTELVLVALVPFAALGIVIGHFLTVESMGPALGGGASLFAFLGGTWFPITGHGFFRQFGELLPSFWLVQAGHVGIGVDHPWPAKAWLVIGAWSVATVALARWAYRRDTRRV